MEHHFAGRTGCQCNQRKPANENQKPNKQISDILPRVIQRFVRVIRLSLLGRQIRNIDRLRRCDYLAQVKLIEFSELYNRAIRVIRYREAIVDHRKINSRMLPSRSLIKTLPPCLTSLSKNFSVLMA